MITLYIFLHTLYTNLICAQLDSLEHKLSKNVYFCCYCIFSFKDTFQKPKIDAYVSKFSEWNKNFDHFKTHG